MIGAPPALHLLSEGAEVMHPHRGKGVLRQVDDDGFRVIEYENGEKHRYGAESVGKFSFNFDFVKGADNKTSEVNDSRLLEKALNLCVVWDMPQMVSRVLTSSAKARAVSPVDGVGSLPEVGRALQRALELQQEHVAQVLWELPGVSFASVNMCRLYLQKSDHSVLASSKHLQMGLRLASNLELTNRFSLTDQQRFVLYRRALDQTFGNVAPILRSFLRRSRQTRAHDVFFWLAFQGNGEIAKQLLP